MFMQTLSIRHNCCHQLSPSSCQTDNHETNGRLASAPSSTSSVCSSQYMETCTKSSLPSPSPSLTFGYEDHSKNTQSSFQCEQPHQINPSSDLTNVNSCSAKRSATNIMSTQSTRVRFIDSSTSAEPSSLSLLFQQSAHINDPLGSNHVIKRTLCSNHSHFCNVPLKYYVDICHCFLSHTPTHWRFHTAGSHCHTFHLNTFCLLL